MFNLFDYDKALDEIDRVAAEPIDDEPYNIIANPKPVVESVCDLNGVKIDMTGWSKGEGVDAASKKVGKAKTAPNAKLTSETAKKTSGEKKDDGKIVEKVDASEKKDDGKVTEVKTATKVEDDKKPKASQSVSTFDSTAKSAQSSNKSGAESKKKKLPDNDIPAKVKIFENAVMSMATDAKTREDVKKVMEAFAPLKTAMLEADGGSIVVKYANRAIKLNKGADGYTLGGAEGSKSLASLVGSRVKVDPSTIQKGQELKMAIEVDGQFKNWHSGSPVTSVTNSGESEAPAKAAPQPSAEAPAEPEDEDSFKSVLKRRNDEMAAKKAADADAMAENEKRRYNAILCVDWNNKEYDVGSVLKAVPKLFEKAGLGAFGNKLKVEPDWSKARERGQMIFVFDEGFKIRRSEEEEVQSMLTKNLDGDVITDVKVNWVAPKVYEEYAEKATYNP